jgi:hypothetical protein
MKNEMKVEVMGAVDRDGIEIEMFMAVWEGKVLAVDMYTVLPNICVGHFQVRGSI